MYDCELLQAEINHINGEFVVSIRCAAHTLQLAIGDFLKKANLQNIISVCVQVVKKLRNPSILTLIKRAGLRKPVLHCTTRWDSTFKMINSLINLKQFCSDYQQAIPELKVSDEKWNQMAKLAKVLTPVHEASLNLQNEQLSMSDFFNIFTKCKLTLNKINSSYSTMFENCLEMRCTNIINSETMLACLYLDPRYQILLTCDQKNKAKAHICKIQNYINNVIQNSEDDDSDVNILQPEDNSCDDKDIYSSDNDLDDIDKLIFLKESELATEKTIPATKECFKNIVDKFDHIQRMNRRDDPKKYWQNSNQRELASIANILFAVPATQVSVERAFSTLKFILTDNRDNIGENILEDILILKLN